MKKMFLSITAFAVLSACQGKSEDTKKDTSDNAKATDTPEGIGAKWCELNGKVHTAATPEEKSAAKVAREAFEEEVEKKYKDDKVMMEKIEAAAEACEDRSEGR
ncbi:MAG: hypothetical protein FJX99_03500 [Bacteroidetes bacterium]|nr:hypothetical protein [Bacteroidota bacterium]